LPSGVEISVPLSPFSLVRNCRFQDAVCSQLKSFKVSGADLQSCTYFGVIAESERDSEEQRSDWVIGVSNTVLLIVESLLPRVSVTCEPLAGVPHTQRRLVAGYLVHREDDNFVSVLYCELRAHDQEPACGAKLVLYENDGCERPVMVIPITDMTNCVDLVGVNSSCFVVDDHHFAARAPSERKIWLRALSNVKVKVLNGAPAPSVEELDFFRMSIREQVQSMDPVLEARVCSDSLLSRGPRRQAVVHDEHALDGLEPVAGLGQMSL